MTKQQTFSRQIKDELCSHPCPLPCCQLAEISTAWFAAGRFHDRSLTLSTAHPGWVSRMTDLIRRRYRSEALWTSVHDLMSLSLFESSAESGTKEKTTASNDLYQSVLRDLWQLFGFNPEKGEGFSLNCSSACCRKAILRALFLACGSISEPSLGYHLELSIRNPAAAAMAISLLDSFGIQAGVLHRHGYSVVYIHEGQYLADYLLLSGAHHSLLAFESLRVEKEMRNTVNRVVNCDSANIQRIANTAARQLDLIQSIRDYSGLGILPPDLQATAEARLAHPDLSLKELGDMMCPPLGKSGMNHRLKRLEKIAGEILAKEGPGCP
jgi:cell division protein WhiA